MTDDSTVGSDAGQNIYKCLSGIRASLETIFKYWTSDGCASWVWCRVVSTKTCFFGETWMSSL